MTGLPYPHGDDLPPEFARRSSHVDVHELRKRMRVAEIAARAAGAVHMRHYGPGVAFQTKEGDRRDLATLADTEGQEAAKAAIAAVFPGEPIVGEEDECATGELRRLLEAGCWLIDPLDGTQSFVHGFPFFAAGIAYVQGNEPLAGAVYLPVYDEMFLAAQGLGAWLNRGLIRVSPERKLADALVGLQIRNAAPEIVDQFLATTGRVLASAHGIRLLGSPMISLAYIACARLDAFATLAPSRLGPWDIAPAAIILREAGGIVAARDGGPLDLMAPGVSGASGRALLDELIAAARG